MVKEQTDVLKSADCVNKTKLLISYLHDCKDNLYLYDLTNGKELFKFQLPIGTILELACKYDQNFVCLVFLLVIMS